MLSSCNLQFLTSVEAVEAGGHLFFSKAGRRGTILLSLSAWDASKGGGGGHHDYDMFFEAGAGPHYCF